MRPLEGCGHWNQPAAECGGLRSDLSCVLMVTRCCRSSWWAWRSYFRRTNSPLQQHPARAPLVAKKISPEDFPNNKTASAVAQQVNLAKSKLIQATTMSLVEDLLFCPYNRAHRIRPDAMPKHLYKCRRNHPKTRLVICPFNTIHHVSGPELNAHIAECPDRAAFELYKYCITDGSRQSHTPTAQEPELIYNNEPPRRSLTPESGFGDSEEATGRSLQDDDECWDESAVPAYNPHAYCKSANVIRKATNMKQKSRELRMMMDARSDDACRGKMSGGMMGSAPAKDNRATVEKKQDMDAMSASFAHKLKMNQ
ncbi:hypothetical protein quinque_014726 [Culex quinquefasciatus]